MVDRTCEGSFSHEIAYDVNWLVSLIEWSTECRAEHLRTSINIYSTFVIDTEEFFQLK